MRPEASIAAAHAPVAQLEEVVTRSDREQAIARYAQARERLEDCLEAQSVQEMNVACSGLARLAALDSDHLGEFAAVCIAICKDCEAECRKHEKHAVCKACADSCKACIAECEKIAA